MKPVYLTLTLIAGVLIGAGGLFAYQEYVRPAPVTSFEECIKANGSQTTLMYPGTCTTRDGKTFTQPVPQEKLDMLVPPTDVPSETPTTPVPQSLQFRRPASWSLWGNETDTFSFAYDASKYNDPTGNLSTNLELNSVACCSGIFFKNAVYDGGSRHAFLKKTTQYAPLSKTVEKNYVIGGNPALFLYNVDASSICTVGAVFTGGTNALIVTSMMCTPNDIEPMLSTFKFR